MTYKPGTVVRVPFPFVDSGATKHRPAVVLSAKIFSTDHRHSAMAMITSVKHSSWSSDVAISGLAVTGLTSPSLVRFKLFTLDNRLISNSIGELSGSDWSSVAAMLGSILPR